MTYCAFKFRDGSVAVARRKQGEVWEFMAHRVLVKKYGPVTVENVSDHLKGYAVPDRDFTNPQDARKAAESLTVKPY